MEKKIDFIPNALEKGIDMARDFLDKLIMPAVEETGLLLRDQVTLWKFKNQVKMLNKARNYCEKNGIAPKHVSLKLLCPLLDYSGIEEDEVLQDKWAILLSNMVDSDQNIENHVFPYILSQLSTKEFLVLEKVFDEKQLRVANLTQNLEEFQASRPKIESDLKSKIDEIAAKIAQIQPQKPRPFNDETWELRKEIRNTERQLNLLKHKESSIIQSIRKPEAIPYGSIQDFELSNLIRLGVVKEEKEFFANSQTLEIPYDRDSEFESSHLKVDLDIDVDSSTENILTQLGELFINACKEKKKNNR